MKSILDVVFYLCCFSSPQSNISSNDVVLCDIDQFEVFEFSFYKTWFERNLINLIIV